MSGISSEASRAQQSGDTRLMTTDERGNLATSSFTIQDLNKQLSRQSDGIALAMAMGGAYLPANKTFAMTFNMATYDGRQALAASAVGRLNENWYVSGSVGSGLTENKFGGRLGLTYGW
jgi:trimeric autotransporter adhesin